MSQKKKTIADEGKRKPGRPRKVVESVDEEKVLSEEEKKERIELFADEILKSYGELYHMAFTGICSIKMNKMELLDKDGDIRLSMVVVNDKEDGKLTVSDVFINHNKEAEIEFTLTPEMKEELRELLLIVLAEQGGILSPKAKALMLVAQQLITGIVRSLQLKNQITEYIETFKGFRKQEKEAESEAPIKSSENKSWDKKYIAQTTIKNKDTKYTIVQGEECILQSIDFYKETKVVVLINSQKNKFDIPFDIFTSFFTPSN